MKILNRGFMKPGIVLCGLLLFAVIAARAQEVARSMEKHPHRTATEAADRLSQKQSRMLSLSGQQSQQIKDINLRYAQQIDSLRTDPQMDHKSKMEKLRSLSTERNSQYKQVLTTDQFKKWNDWQLQHKQTAKEKKPKHP